MKAIIWIIFGGLCVIFSTYPVQYFLAEEPIALLSSKSPELLSSLRYNISFYAHITFGGIALLIGWLQFSKKLRATYLNLHRLIGKLYVAAVLISGPFGFYIGFFATGGLSPKLGFTIGAVLWVVLTYLAYASIRKGNIAAHKAYMIYSYAGTFGAVTLRLWLPILMAIFGSFTEAYQVVAWLSWLPNLIIAWFIIRREEKDSQITGSAEMMEQPFVIS
ncbi:MAG: DUF2306 domain-containing protein [Bacteroidota bacterium]